MPLKEKYYSKIKEIIENFGLYNKGNHSNSREYLYKSPKISLGELVVKCENKEISENEINSFLQKRLDLSEEKAEKLKNALSKEILSRLEQESAIIKKKKEKDTSNKNLNQDKYREPLK